MCANYLPTRHERIEEYFGVSYPAAEFPPETFPGYMAPIVRQQHDQDANSRDCVLACFGMVPYWADLKLARQTYNARAETVASRPTYRNAWRQGHFCIIPADAFYEPSYETGKPSRWKIADSSGKPLAIAGIWEWRGNGPNDSLTSFSMLTVNADGHPLMRRFHKPGDEKRMVVLLEPAQYDSWLHATPSEALYFLNCYPTDKLTAEPAPRPHATRAPMIKAKPRNPSN